ncbi:PREDICTED: uncharacterized protein LOC109310035 [Crocodylus porosus]|uniref:uncharacterized protein LOC109310035 n=1 Tax=Crocodylus porosus TaxID=8502 RepID=UPI00093F60D7|nr:PREDICTED: uncharacterized protein LOC109310035 [Crocodylus porosus]
MARLGLFLLLLHVRAVRGVPGPAATFTLNCPQAPCWHYWHGHCYCIERSRTGTWIEALRYCKRYRDTELLTITNPSEKMWILKLPLDNFWTGLNNLEDMTNFRWSEGSPADLTAPWSWITHPVQPNTPYCVKISNGNLIPLDCNAKAHWICKRSADVERYQEHKAKVLLSSTRDPLEVHADLHSAKEACLELREKCTGISTWQNVYALAGGTALMKSEESNSYAYVKSDCAMGYFGKDCSSVCSLCYNNGLCNPYTGTCNDFHFCSAQSAPTACQREMKSLWCPRFPGWSYWEGNCYFVSTETSVSWVKARQMCRRFRSADLLWIGSQKELAWLLSLITSETFWIGLNSRQQESIWIWSNGNSAAKELHWLPMSGDSAGRCAGMKSTSSSILKLNCEDEHRWLCKKTESPNIFDVFLERYLSGPLSSKKIYDSLHDAKVDCLYDNNCTGVVKVSNYFRRVAGIDEIHFSELAADSDAVTYVKQECSFGYYGENCVHLCPSCRGKFRCNSVMGKCPEKLTCMDQFKGEICESGLTSLKCPQDPIWWYWNGNCYYIERKEMMPWEQGLAQCTFYNNASLAKIDNEEEKMWVASMLEGDAWIGLSRQKDAWNWINGHEAELNSSWLSDIQMDQHGCAQIKKGGILMATNCSTHLYWVCKKPADVDIFLEYPGNLLLSLAEIAQYKTLTEAKFYCAVTETCTGINSWPSKFSLVSGTEMVTATIRNTVYLKTSCVSGQYGYGCREACPNCRNNLPCNSLTGICDENTRCLAPFSTRSCVISTVSLKCPEFGWQYWKRYCYFILPANWKPWKDANTTCSRYRGAELLWFESVEELTWITAVVFGETWTGLQDINQDGIWAWAHEDSASSVLPWLVLKKKKRQHRCVELTADKYVSVADCNKAKGWVCKKAAEPDLDVFMGFWDTVTVSPTLRLSNNYTNHTLAREQCVKQKRGCLGYMLWRDVYLLINNSELVIGGFAPSVTYLKSACNVGYYGLSCEQECSRCYWDMPCNSISGECVDSVVCAVPEDVGACDLGKYSLKCPLGFGWWYRNGWCYLIEGNRSLSWMEARLFCSHFKGTSLLQLESSAEKDWLHKMIKWPVWIGMNRATSDSAWQWIDGATVDTWIKVQGNATANCVAVWTNEATLQGVDCLSKHNFVCKRRESENMFQFYAGYIIMHRQNAIPKVHSSLKSAENACLYERTHCTGIVYAKKQYHLIGGTEIFRSSYKADSLYLKTGCQPGYYGSDCQSTCHPCDKGLPCNGVTGHCVGTSSVTCSLQSQDPQCSPGEVSRQLCPQRPEWHYFLKTCYYIEDTKTKTWSEARRACQGFKDTDLAIITNSVEKTWIQFKGENSWIGMTYKKEDSLYMWVDGKPAHAESAWVIRTNRRHTLAKEDCVVALKHYFSPAHCFSLRKWICKRKEVLNYFTVHEGRVLYSPYVPASNIYNNLMAAKDACSHLQNCTGVVVVGKHNIVQTGTELYNSRNRTVKTLIKSDCVSGRFGPLCEHECPPCQQGVSCNPHTGKCGDTVFCTTESSSIPCEKGSLFGGSCPVEDEWQYWQGSCYYIPRAKRQSWQHARDLCRRYRDTDLLWLAHPEEKEWLFSKVPKASFWTGLYGVRWCSVLKWSNSQIPFARSAWLSLHKWTVTAKCCVQLNALKGLLAAVYCFQKAPWICKRKEEGTIDFQEFQGYYVVGTYTSNSSYQSSLEAVQLCRFQLSTCNAVGMIKGEYRTMFATQLLLISGALGDESAAYVKSACASGYYGPECQGSCTCNKIENCSPFTGECAEYLQCSEKYVAQQCQRGVVSLKCPENPGWWYWNGRCYYIEETNSSTWLEAKNFCTAYNGTDLLVLDSAEEEAWITSVLNKPAWIGSVGSLQRDKENMGRKNQHILVSHTKNTTLTTCNQLTAKGSLNQVNCSSSASWVCKRNEGNGIFWKYPRMLLLQPVGGLTYTFLEVAVSACIIAADCSGVTYWGESYIPVSGKELIFSRKRKVAVYLKSACSEGRYGMYCQQKCPRCLSRTTCNRITGLCDGAVTCQEMKKLELCEYDLTSKMCFPFWKYWNGNCYYIPAFGALNKSGAEFMCSQYEGSQLLKLQDAEEQRWIAKVISKKSWLLKLSHNLQSKTWIMPGRDTEVPHWGFQETQDLCIQIEPVNGTLISSPCSELASWICKVTPVPGAQDSSYIWWKSLVLSLFVSVLVVSATVLGTYKAARWRRAVSLVKGNDEAEQKSESEERKGQGSPRSRRSSPSN